MTTPLTMFASSGSLVDLDSTIFIQLAVFLFIFIILRSLLFKPIARLIEARHQATEVTRSDAEAIEREATQLNEEVTARLAKVRAEATAERSRLEEQARQQQRELVINAREEAHKLAEETREQMDRQAAEAKQYLQNEIGQIASLVAHKALGRTV